MSSALRRAAQEQAVEEGVTYEDIVAAQVGTSLLGALTHYDRRTAMAEYFGNRRHARHQARKRRDLRRSHGYTVERRGWTPPF